MIKNWKGVWIEANSEYFSKIQVNFKDEIDKEIIKVKNAFVNGENVENLFEEFRSAI